MQNQAVTSQVTHEAADSNASSSCQCTKCSPRLAQRSQANLRANASPNINTSRDTTRDVELSSLCEDLSSMSIHRNPTDTNDTTAQSPASPLSERLTSLPRAPRRAFSSPRAPHIALSERSSTPSPRLPHRTLSERSSTPPGAPHRALSEGSSTRTLSERSSTPSPRVSRSSSRIVDPPEFSLEEGVYTCGVLHADTLSPSRTPPTTPLLRCGSSDSDGEAVSLRFDLLYILNLALHMFGCSLRF